MLITSFLVTVIYRRTIMANNILLPILFLWAIYVDVDAVSDDVMARYVLHNTDWVSLGTIAVEDSIKGYPFVNMKSHVDGPKDGSNGNVYLYLTDLDIASKNIKVDSRVSVLATLAGTDYCTRKNYNPQDPRCPKVMITGKFLRLEKSDPEYKMAKESLFAKHPVMATWPPNHFFFVAKIVPEEVRVMHEFTGMVKVDIKDYLGASPNDFQDEESKPSESAKNGV
ncbi:unnamed protein product [Acanthoscelides obtectus]|uniref:CREG-like beta-barrel domain-containing protein n=1 Tax=Acanthoscelides obtectus TaxID=200917 RepID=A0A9P0PHJ2_ACAOB|nr:unnamed protein product [Acanthoscelides obtectus]CAK1653140.1 Protein CREG1 [Acanthoscelides obtectus]